MREVIRLENTEQKDKLYKQILYTVWEYVYYSCFMSSFWKFSCCFGGFFGCFFLDNISSELLTILYSSKADHTSTVL